MEPIGNVYAFIPDRFKAEDDQGIVDFTVANIRKLLGGTRRAIARVAIRHFEWCFSRSKGGVVDPTDGIHWYDPTTLERERPPRPVKRQQGQETVAIAAVTEAEQADREFFRSLTHWQPG